MLVLLPRMLQVLRWMPKIVTSLVRGTKFACLAFADRILEGVQNGLKFLSPPPPVAEPTWYSLFTLNLGMGNFIALLLISGLVAIFTLYNNLERSRKEVAALKSQLKKLEPVGIKDESCAKSEASEKLGNCANELGLLTSIATIKRNQHSPRRMKLVENPGLNNPPKRGGLVKDLQ